MSRAIKLGSNILPALQVGRRLKTPRTGSAYYYVLWSNSAQEVLVEGKQAPKDCEKRSS